MILVCLNNFLKFHFIYYYFQYFIAYNANRVSFTNEELV
jgi:hypothetical protein